MVKRFNMDNVIVVLIIALAAGYVIRSFVNKMKNDKECGCGCSRNCSEPPSKA
jgi:hypothetical protein